MTLYTDLILDTAGLLGHWTCEKLADNSLPDSLGLHPIQGRANMQNTPGPIDGEFAIGASPEVTSPPFAEMDGAPAAALSIWARYSNFLSYGYAQMTSFIGAGGNNFSLAVNYSLSFDGGNTYLTDRLIVGVDNKTWASENPRPSDGLWHHYALQVDRASGVPELFVDGEPIVFGSETDAPIAAGFTAVPVKIWTGAGNDLVVSQYALFNRTLTPDEIMMQFKAMNWVLPGLEPSEVWVTSTSGLAFVRIPSPSEGEQAWADMLAVAINSGIAHYINTPVTFTGKLEVRAAAHRAFGYAWKYREAPFGEAQALNEEGLSIRLAKDWLDQIKPVLDRYRDVTQMVG